MDLFEHTSLPATSVQWRNAPVLPFYTDLLFQRSGPFIRAWLLLRHVLCGKYDVHVDGSKEPKLAIDKIKVGEKSQQISITSDGKIEIYADTFEEILRLKLIAQVGVKYATGWLDCGLSIGEVRDVETQEKVTFPIHFETSASALHLRRDDFESTWQKLSGLESDHLLFLTRAAELKTSHSELSVLSVLTALELIIHWAFDLDENDLSLKLKILKYFKVLPEAGAWKLRCLVTIRNKLAHGRWADDVLNGNIQNLLSGKPRDLFFDNGRMKKATAERLLEQILEVIPVLTNAKSDLSKVRLGK